MKKWNKERFATIWENLESMIKLRSLRARIFLLILVIGLVPCIVMRHGIVSNYEDMAVEQRITVVQNQLMILANHLVSNNYLSSHGVREDTGNSREVINAELEMLSNLYEGRVMIINKNFKVEKDTYGISEGKTIISEEVIKCFQGENISHYDPEHGYIEMTTPIMDTTANTTDENGKKNPDAIRGVMLTSISNDSIVNAREVLNRKAYIMEVIMIVAILALAILLSRVLTMPFNRVTQAINAVREGFSDETISVPDYVETVHIVDAFNQLLKRMKALDDSRQEFVANGSSTLGAGSFYRIAKVGIPAAMPHMFLGLFNGTCSSFITLVTAEMLGAKYGIGWYINWQKEMMAYANVYAGLIIIAVTFFILITLLFKFRDRVLAWQKGVIKW